MPLWHLLRNAMTSPAPDLAALSRGRGSAAIHVEAPPSRVVTRVLVPLLIVLAALGLVGYAARAALQRDIIVRVAPAVLRVGGAEGVPAATPGEVVQAPGWIEADPSAISVPALAGGVIEELLVLDGERVEAGQPVARLVDADAQLARRRALAEVSRTAAATAKARAAVLAEEARVAEARDAFDRVESLGQRGVVPEGEIAARRLLLATRAATAATAQAAVAMAKADETMAQVALEEANLLLERMTVRAPVAGMVLQRRAEPGQRMMPASDNPFAGVVVRLYDPAHLQVRVDVPLADAAKVRVGDLAEISTETLPGRMFQGTLTRFVHEADIQKNTVQVKVAIADPAAELKPDMLAKARIMTRGSAPDSLTQAVGTTDQPVLLIPVAALVDVQDRQAAAWVVQRESQTAAKRALRLGRTGGESAEVLEGLRVGDRVILTPPAGLSEGAKVRVENETEGA